ncbi:MAG: DUF1127 domain-containing protein [Cypionkella sp.]
MAYVNSSRAVSNSTADRFTGLFAGLSAALARRRIYNQTLSELRALSDRDLTDLGISRSMISSVARDAAYGK